MPKRIDLTFTGPSYASEYPLISAQKSVNFYPRPIPEGEGKFALIGTPGLELLLDLGTTNGGRGLHPSSLGDFLYAVADDKVFKVDPEFGPLKIWNATEIGTLNSDSGEVSMADNGVELLIVDGTAKGYLYQFSTGVFSNITDVDFPTSSMCTFQDGFFLVIQDGTNRFWQSDFQDGSAWQEFGSKGGTADPLVAIISDHRDLWLIGTQTSEPFRNDGSEGLAFSIQEGSDREFGTIAPFSLAQAADALFFVIKDKAGSYQVVRIRGFAPQIISGFPEGFTLDDVTEPETGIGMAYQERGHTFYVLTFKTDNVTMVWDETNSRWHDRSSRIDRGNRIVDAHWRINNMAFFFNINVGIDTENGKLYKVTSDVYDEDGEEIKAVRRGQTIRNNQDLITYYELQVLFEPGVGLVTGQGSDPVASLRYSDDGGRTWSPYVESPIGQIGQFDQRGGIWYQLGTARNRVFEVMISDPVERVIIGAFVMADVNAY